MKTFYLTMKFTKSSVNTSLKWLALQIQENKNSHNTRLLPGLLYFVKLLQNIVFSG